MKTRSGCLLLVLAAILACVEPADRRPGTWLSGEVVAGPVDDWSFTREHGEIMIETSTAYGIPHSVTIVCADLDGRLYVGALNPESKRWVGNVARDPEVRLKIGDRVYEQRLARIDPASGPEQQDLYEKVYRAYAAKYDRDLVSASERPPLWYWEVVERDT